MNIYKLTKLIARTILYSPAIPIVIIIRLLAPIFTIRFLGLAGSRIGPLAAITELYLCEKEAGINIPKRLFFDIVYIKDLPICNHFLISLWKRTILIWPRWLIYPITWLNEFIPGGTIHKIKTTKNDRDINNLIDNSKQHVYLNSQEELIGKKILLEMGVPENKIFVCLLVRDNAYLKKNVDSKKNWDYHNYRDNSIENFLDAAEFLVTKGYYVIRMGREVNEDFYSEKHEIIDYAKSKWRSDLMDIYLASKCHFCISTGSGWDALVETLFRKPIIHVNLVPFAQIHTYSKYCISTTKRHYSEVLKRDLTISEIFEFGLANAHSSLQYNEKKIKLIENTQEEILDVVKEMLDLLNGEVKAIDSDNLIAAKFWKIFIDSINKYLPNESLHCEIKSLYSITYLKKYITWLN